MSRALPIRVIESAASAITEAAEWWIANRSKAPGAFKEELERAFQIIASHPTIGARAQNVRLADVRRFTLPAFTITYTIASRKIRPQLKFWRFGIRAAVQLRPWKRRRMKAPLHNEPN